MSVKDHWESVYTAKEPVEVSWFQAHAEASLRLIESTHLGSDASVIDVGAGASTLVDDLLRRGYENVSVLDLSGAALAASRHRLGAKARQVQWLEADIVDAALPAHHYDLWHDRAVFHFLTQKSDRRAYVGQLSVALKPGGFAIIATFAEDGPSQCSGLPVMRYNALSLAAELGPGFQLVNHAQELHLTPAQGEQRFVFCLFQRA